jgi:hypothetical protein
MLASQEEHLTRFLDSHPLGHERAAIVLFRRLHVNVPGLTQSDRYLAVEIIPFDDSWIQSSSGAHVAFELKHFRELLRRCEEESLVFGFVHNHPGGPPEFSSVDDANEETLVTAIRNRNGDGIHFIAMLWSQGKWKARIRHGAHPRVSERARHVLIVARPFRLHLDAPISSDDELFERQAAAFGRPFIEQLHSLRIAVVGAGGTGSPTIALLARAGVGEIVVIDGDKLERSNLNRVRGARVDDVGNNKAVIQKQFVDGLGLPVQVAAIDCFVDLSPQAVDALASCDVIFGCTDDQVGRELLNACVYVYAQAYIDVGLGGQVNQDESGRPYLRYHFGRISTILPESGECLFCQGVIRDVWIRHQYAARQEPGLTESNAQERYLERGGEQAPGIGPFTSAVADYAVATLFDLVRPFRRFRAEIRPDFFKIDFVHMEIRSSQETNDRSCSYCRQHAYLLRPEASRLNRPLLGKRNVAI